MDVAAPCALGQFDECVSINRIPIWFHCLQHFVVSDTLATSTATVGNKTINQLLVVKPVLMSRNWDDRDGTLIAVFNGLSEPELCCVAAMCSSMCSNLHVINYALK